MTIPRVWTNGVASMPVDARGRPLLSSADLAKVDGSSQRAVDKSWLAGSQPVVGPITLAAGGLVRLDSSTSSWVASGAGKNYSTATGGRIACNDSDYPTFSSPRARAAHVAPTEMVWSGFSAGYPFPAGVVPIGWWYLDPASLWLQPGNHNVGVANAALAVSFTRAHDGATTTSASAYFAVHSGRTQLPSRYPSISIFEVDPFLGSLAQVAPWTAFPTPGSLAAYKNGATSGQNGTPNVVVASFAEPLDDSSRAYVALVLDEDYNGSGTEAQNFPNEYAGLDLAVSASDLRFQ